jgi:hypothetical protein
MHFLSSCRPAGRLLAASALVFALAASASGSETIIVEKNDHLIDTAIAIQFALPDGSTKSVVVSMDGGLTQMVMCKATLRSQLPHLIRGLRAQPEFDGMKPVGANCVRTKGNPRSAYP